MTVIARRISAIPVRSASEVWQVIVNLLTSASETEAYKELIGVTGIASSLISSEVMKDSPIIIYGSNPRLRIYCLYGEDAISGESASESSLPFKPTEGDWRMSLPCPEDELDWIQKALEKQSKHIAARDMTKTIQENQSISDGRSFVVDLETFLRS